MGSQPYILAYFAPSRAKIGTYKGKLPPLVGHSLIFWGHGGLAPIKRPVKAAPKRNKDPIKGPITSR